MTIEKPSTPTNSPPSPQKQSPVATLNRIQSDIREELAALPVKIADPVQRASREAKLRVDLAKVIADIDKHYSTSRNQIFNPGTPVDNTGGEQERINKQEEARILAEAEIQRVKKLDLGEVQRVINENERAERARAELEALAKARASQHAAEYKEKMLSGEDVWEGRDGKQR